MSPCLWQARVHLVNYDGYNWLFVWGVLLIILIATWYGRTALSGWQLNYSWTHHAKGSMAMSGAGQNCVNFVSLFVRLWASLCERGRLLFQLKYLVFFVWYSCRGVPKVVCSCCLLNLILTPLNKSTPRTDFSRHFPPLWKINTASDTPHKILIFVPVSPESAELSVTVWAISSVETRLGKTKVP